MKELYVFCEGATEEGFCKKLLELHLFPQYDGLIHPIKIGRSKHHGKVRRGGVPGRYETMRRDIVNMLKSRTERDVFFTTMIDLYGLPKDFPGKHAHTHNPDNPTPYVEAREQAFGNDVADARFIPYLQLHEYETLLFADPESFRIAFDNCDRAIEQLTTIAGAFPGIEHIDDDPMTAPSKRIIKLFPGYEGRKTSAGPDIAELTGLTVIRARCPHFDAWLTRLEGLWKSE